MAKRVWIYYRYQPAWSQTVPQPKNGCVPDRGGDIGEQAARHMNFELREPDGRILSVFRSETPPDWD